MNGFMERLLRSMTTRLPLMTRSSRRALLVIAMAATASLALPTLSWRPATKVVTADDKAAAGQNEKKPGDPAAIAKKSPDVEYSPRPTKDEQKILDALTRPTTVEFLDLP